MKSSQLTVHDSTIAHLFSSFQFLNEKRAMRNKLWNEQWAMAIETSGARA